MKRKFEITNASAGAAFSVRVVTRTAQAEIAGLQSDGILKVRLTSAPDDPKVNEELIAFLAKTLAIEIKHIEVVAGENSRDKIVSVEGISPEYLESKIIQLSKDKS